MRDFARQTCIAAGMVISLISLPLATAHEGATGVVKERMDAMEDMAKAMKGITQRVKAKRDLGSINADARTIEQLAQKIPSVFPPGSNQHPSGAKPAIWQKWPDFETKARALAVESGKLANTDVQDAKSIAAQIRAVSQICSSCHEVYRVKMPKHEHR
jgi:cytochrome c556